MSVCSDRRRLGLLLILHAVFGHRLALAARPLQVRQDHWTQGVLPKPEIPHGAIEHWLAFRQGLREQLEQWHDHLAEERYLVLGEARAVAVHEGRRAPTHVLLAVALGEELLQGPVRPRDANIFGLRRVRDVGQVQQENLQLFGIPFEDVPHVGPVAERLRGLRFARVRVELVECLQVLDHGEVVGVIRVQDRLDAHLARRFEIGDGEALEDVGVRLLGNPEKVGTMQVLQR
mmetsp:Transcript_84697/g.258595  ORF Transcript_84697/g.258595 Transcript_84697/m.258595 type:complete len:232 (-) Transcript_84697:2191-2886(-)